jgi:hypothetical protein
VTLESRLAKLEASVAPSEPLRRLIFKGFLPEQYNGDWAAMNDAIEAEGREATARGEQLIAFVPPERNPADELESR